MDPELFAAVFSRTSPRRRRRRRLFPTFLFSLRATSSNALRVASIESHELFPGPRTDCRCLAFAFRKPPTWMPRKGSSPDRRRSLVHVLQERSYTQAALRKRQLRAEVLFEEFQPEALVVVSPRFTAIITRTLLDVAGDYTGSFLTRLLSGLSAGKRQ